MLNMLSENEKTWPTGLFTLFMSSFSTPKSLNHRQGIVQIEKIMRGMHFIYVLLVNLSFATVLYVFL